MKFHVLLCLLFSYNCANYAHTQNSSLHPAVVKLRQHADADWLIVGAGPAGIAIIGVLIDIGINPTRITWIDPEFNVGRLGAYYSHVPANNKTQEFIEFVKACQCFQECTDPAVQELCSCNGQEYNCLGVVIEPLKCITHHLRTKVHDVKDMITSLHFEEGVWQIGTAHSVNLSAVNVVLATGSHPKTLDYETQKVIPLDFALDPYTLHDIITPQDIIGVVGSSHSAILLLKFLSEGNVEHIYNFYRHPLIYAVDMGDWVMNSFSGLKGATAQWAQEVLEKNPPTNITRLKSTHEILSSVLPTCSKVIYAVGYEKNEIPTDSSVQLSHFDSTTGYIAPRLFGIGIAFPEVVTDKIGEVGTCVGLDCFMDYAQKMIPQWLAQQDVKRAQDQVRKFKHMSGLFSIWNL